MESVVIDKIDTKAMEMALLEGQTPFALFKPSKGIPVLVKVSPTGAHKNVKLALFIAIQIKVLYIET